MYMLHENGRKLFTSPEDCTPRARYCYLMAKQYHEEKARDKAEKKYGPDERPSNIPR